MQVTRVFVVDDHPMIRHGLAAMLSGQRDLQWVGDAGDGAEAVRLAPPLAPDVLLVGLAMPRMDGVAAIAALQPLLPNAKFVMLASMIDPTEARRALAAGASGFLLKRLNAGTRCRDPRRAPGPAHDGFGAEQRIGRQ